jgi:hypothetical protein
MVNKDNRPLEGELALSGGPEELVESRCWT